MKGIFITTRRTVLHRGLLGLIDELVITRDYRGQGIGKQLIAAAIEKCRQLGCCEVEVSTEKANSKAREFYKQCGFKERGILLEIDLGRGGQKIIESMRGWSRSSKEYKLKRRC